MKVINDFFIKLLCKEVGNDEFGNKYYLNKKGKRFVIYNGIAEPTKIPAHWHGWIHYTTNSVPNNTNKHSWQKIHLPNLTATQNKYSPKNSISSKSNSQYEAWNPENKASNKS